MELEGQSSESIEYCPPPRALGHALHREGKEAINLSALGRYRGLLHTLQKFVMKVMSSSFIYITSIDPIPPPPSTVSFRPC